MLGEGVRRGGVLWTGLGRGMVVEAWREDVLGSVEVHRGRERYGGVVYMC